jgi:hypothetical protein
VNVEEYEHGMDAEFRHAETIWRTCMYDTERDDADHERAEGEEPDG